MRDEIIALKGVIKELVFWKVNKDRLNEKWDGTDDRTEIESIKKELEINQTYTRKMIVDLSFRQVSIIECVRSLYNENILEEDEAYDFIKLNMDELNSLNRGLIVRSIMNDRKLDVHLLSGVSKLQIEI